MPTTAIDFGQRASEKLAPLGLKLASARGTLALDDRSWFEAPASVQTALSSGTLVQVGAFASLAGGTMGNVRIGRCVSIAAGVVIGSHEHPIDWLTSSRITHYPQMHDWHRFLAPEGEDPARLAAALRRPFHGACPVTEIGNDVWIGQGVFIRAGVTIGDGAVIGARSTVVKDIPPYTIAAGVPAKPIRPRFGEALVERLTALRWWRFSPYDLAGVPFEDVPAALDAIEERIGRGTLKEYEAPRHTPTSLRALFA